MRPGHGQPALLGHQLADHLRIASLRNSQSCGGATFDMIGPDRIAVDQSLLAAAEVGTVVRRRKCHATIAKPVGGDRIDVRA